MSELQLPKLPPRPLRCSNIYFVAGNLREMEAYALRVGFHPDRCVLVTHPDQLLGRGKGLRVILVGSWKTHPNLEMITKILPLIDAEVYRDHESTKINLRTAEGVNQLFPDK